MGIQEEIKQTNFRSPYQKAFINILYTNNWLQEEVRGMLQSEELTHQQFNVLRILRGSHPKPLSTLQIRERMLDKMSDSSRIVDRLMKKEHVTKTTCENDKRLVDVSITKLGLEKLLEIDKKEVLIDNSLHNLSEEEAETLSHLLDKIRKQD
jgi:MarR family 2-MHQ and catechol resistance regulon transcriptional repressor